ncbi:FACT complex subunit SSRP1 [Trichoplax sp. H2]|nr:FACT complex subunit SSRP1 [Trichoplax sp. H2]|eukprot:RDD41116.1 FACT complex subunit SSRP1 [Trichoplax sp. H2]
MAIDSLDFEEVFVLNHGILNPGRLKLSAKDILFKASKTGKVDKIMAGQLMNASWFRAARGYELRLALASGVIYKFEGFKEADYDKLADLFSGNYNIQLEEKELSVKGFNWGNHSFEGSSLSLNSDSSMTYEIPLNEVCRSTVGKNEVTLEFHQHDDAQVSLMEMRFHLPATNNEDEDYVQTFNEKVLAKATIIQATGDAIAEFTEVSCLTPRGRYNIKLFPTFIQLHGKTYDYKIALTSILRMFLLPHPDERHFFFVFTLDPPLKQGQTRYPFFIIQFIKEEEISFDLNLSQEELNQKYENKVNKTMEGPIYEIFSRLLKALTDRKITLPGAFIGSTKSSSVSCSHKNSSGFLYPLSRGFIYVHKPPVHIRPDEIVCVNFARVSGGGTIKTFDFEVITKNSVIYTFSNIDKSDYTPLYDYTKKNNLPIKNKGLKRQSHKDELLDSEDEDDQDHYLARVKAEGEEKTTMAEEGEESDSTDDEDEDFNPDESSDNSIAEEYDTDAINSSDSDYEENQGKRKKAIPVPREFRAGKKAKKKNEVKPAKKVKNARDPNLPKRPLSGYMLWLQKQRDRIKNENPSFTVAEVAKKAGEIWKSLKEEEKKKWNNESAKLKEQYNKDMAEYNEQNQTKATTSKSKKATPKKSSKSPMKYKSAEYVDTDTSSESSSEEESEQESKIKSAEFVDTSEDTSDSSDE